MATTRSMRLCVKYSPIGDENHLRMRGVGRRCCELRSVRQRVSCMWFIVFVCPSVRVCPSFIIPRVRGVDYEVGRM